MKKKRRVEYSTIDYHDEVKRLNRVIGQIDGIRKMLEEQRKLKDILIQCKAVQSALKSVESRILKAHVSAALDEIVKLEKKKLKEQKVAELEELYRYSN